VNLRFSLIYDISEYITHLGMSIVIDEFDDVGRSVFEDFLNEGLNNRIDSILEIVFD
jgi:hypothetical protein